MEGFAFIKSYFEISCCLLLFCCNFLQSPHFNEQLIAFSWFWAFDLINQKIVSSFLNIACLCCINDFIIYFRHFIDEFMWKEYFRHKIRYYSNEIGWLHQNCSIGLYPGCYEYLIFLIWNLQSINEWNTKTFNMLSI